MIDQDKMRALAAELRKGSGGRYKWYAMGRDETSYFMDFDWGYDADRWFADQQKSRAAWIEQEGIHIVKKLFQTELETNAAAAADAIDLLLAEVEAGKQQIDALLATVAECREKAFVEGYADSLLSAAVGSPDEVPAFVGQTVAELRAELEAAKCECDELRDLHAAGCREAYSKMGIEDDGEYRWKWVLLGISGLVGDVKKFRAELEAAAADKRDYLDTFVQVLNVIGYSEEFAEANPDLKVSEGVKLFLAQRQEGS
ncbi:hypothetical protein BDI4_600036 [Burkholderia diffusa]|uniref:hypothetical protein n=1 Tax=Burkholderia diffusa TaxID=488732 RepID=UPI001CACE5FD|nr:hypothetical protein [Burkholderia diffusa]CAG9259489.1 hypothetical protein BDI4_600036 [Burkholderia diffusa]